MTTMSHDYEDPCIPLVTLSVLDAPITAETRHGGDEVHLLFGPVTLILAGKQATKVVSALYEITQTELHRLT